MAGMGRGRGRGFLNKPNPGDSYLKTNSESDTWDSEDDCPKPRFSRPTFGCQSKISDSSINDSSFIDDASTLIPFDEESMTDGYATTGSETEYEDVTSNHQEELPKGIDLLSEVLKHGYLHPNEIKIPSHGNWLKRGARRACFSGEIVNMSEFYLTFFEAVPEDINSFIETMTAFYKREEKGLLHEKMMLCAKYQLIKPGGIIACRNNDKTARDDREFVRARIVGEVLPRKKRDGRRYKVFFIDLGRYNEVGHWEMYFLHVKFVTEPGFSIRCRASLGINYSKYHSGEKNWSATTTAEFIQAMKTESNESRLLNVDFVHKIPKEAIWEVSMVNTLPPLDENVDRLQLNYGIERIVIRRTMAVYHIDPKEDKTRHDQMVKRRAQRAIIKQKQKQQ